MPCSTSSAVARPGNRLADKRFVVAPPIRIGGVEQRNAPIQRFVNQRDALVVVARAIDARKRHAAKSDRGNADTGRPERTRRQASTLSDLSVLKLLSIAVAPNGPGLAPPATASIAAPSPRRKALWPQYRHEIEGALAYCSCVIYDGI